MAPRYVCLAPSPTGSGAFSLGAALQDGQDAPSLVAIIKGDTVEIATDLSREELRALIEVLESLEGEAEDPVYIH